MPILAPKKKRVLVTIEKGGTRKSYDYIDPKTGLDEKTVTVKGHVRHQKVASEEKKSGLFSGLRRKTKSEAEQFGEFLERD